MSVGVWQLLGFAVTSIGGTALHFLYENTGNLFWAAPFSGVNESTWEHMKLLFFPMFFFAIFQSFFFGNRSDFWSVKLRGTLLGLALIPVIFYTYNGAIGKSPDPINIAIFFVSALAAYVYETRLFKRENYKYREVGTAFFALLFIAMLFVAFTFKTPHIGIFRDPIKGTYGLP